jgi:hypothetical protein
VGGPRRWAEAKAGHTSASVILIPHLVLPILVVAWAIVLLIASATIGYRLFLRTE